MSERLITNSEHKNSFGNEVNLSKNIENRQNRPEKNSDKVDNSKTNIENLNQSAKLEALNSTETNVESTDEETSTPFVIQKHYKKTAYKQTLKSIRRQLPNNDKMFSGIIHQPVIEKISDISSSTIARPWGLLGGGIIALIGNTALLYMSRHYGFKYNYLMFAIFFVGGYIAVSIIEIIFKTLTKNKNID